jgi:uncharacterized protein
MYISDKIIYVRLNKKSYLLFNTLSGAMDIVNKELANQLQQNKLELVPAETKKVLLERNYLFESRQKEISTFSRICETFAEKNSQSAPEFVLIPSYRCNLKCQYCYEANLRDKGKPLNTGSLPVLWKAMKYIAKKHISKNAPRITLMGGEPLLRNNYKLISRILMQCSSEGWKVEIITNGTTLNQYAELLSRHNVKGVQVTIDGIKNVHDQRRMFKNGEGSFLQIMQGITSLLEKGIKIYLRVNLDSQNIEKLPLLANFIQQQEWMKSKLCIPYLYAMSEGGCLKQTYTIKESEVLKKIISLSVKHSEMNIFEWRFHGLDHMEAALQGKMFTPMTNFCSATTNQYVFDQRGKIYACWWGIGKKEFEIGKFMPNLCWHKDNLMKWRNRSIATIPQCQKCKFALICGGGCAEKAIEEEGGIDKPRCSAFEEIISLAAPFLIAKYQH